MIASAQTLRLLKLIEPFRERTTFFGLTFGLSPAGYDVRLDFSADAPDSCWIHSGQFMLGSTIECFTMPDNLLGIVHDKSTWARRGLCVQNTVIEPGWRGYLTLELTNHGKERLYLCRGMPIAQIVFHFLDKATEVPYAGKYQDQERGPQEAR